MEHVGGFRPDEISDINQYSQHGLLRPVTTCVETQPAESPEQEDDLLLVTTL